MLVWFLTLIKHLFGFPARDSVLLLKNSIKPKIDKNSLLISISA